MMYNYDLAIIGAGWAGFNAADKAAQAGLRICLIEKDLLGGTCLNRGCIPTKTLLQSAKIYFYAKNSRRFGIETQGLGVGLAKIQEKKQFLLKQLRSGMEFRLKKRSNIVYLRAKAEFVSAQELLVNQEKIRPRHIIIATGSYPAQIPFLKFDGKKIVSSEEVLNLTVLPRSVLIVGAGVIGCEFASFFSMLGVKVTIVEIASQLLPQEDNEIAARLESLFRKNSIKVNTGTDVRSVDLQEHDLVLVAVGRRPYLQGLNLEKAGIKTENGKIATDEFLRTNVSHIFAVGDCSTSTMLAHYAAYQGKMSVQNILSPEKMQPIQKKDIPNCIFTYHEVATIGLKEKEARQIGRPVDTKKFHFRANAMAHILDETEGFIKVVFDRSNDSILGASIIGPKATEILGIFTLAIQLDIKVSQLRKVIFAHPTISEAVAQIMED
jgi:dihydrolipoamide dehydrogenase